MAPYFIFNRRRTKLTHLGLGYPFSLNSPPHPHIFFKKMFKLTEKLKEFYYEHSCTVYLDYVVNILLYLLYHITVHLSVPQSIYQSILFVDVLQSQFKHQYTSPQTFQHVYH